MVDDVISGEYDVVVVGAGIMGSCTAYEASKEKISTVKFFATEMAKRLPFSSLADAIDASRFIWWNQVNVLGWLEAFSAHPRIGDVEALKKEKNSSEPTVMNYAVEFTDPFMDSFPGGEQSAALTTANEQVLQELVEWNKRYEEKFGHIFIICASGKSSQEILVALQKRYTNKAVDELRTAAEEEHKITELRLAKLDVWQSKTSLRKEFPNGTMADEVISGEYDVVVVGAGIMGSCTAYELAKRKKSVLLLEQFDFLHRRGSSHGESRTIRITYPEEYYTKMMVEAYDLWSQAERDAGYTVYTKTGQLDFGPRDNPSLGALIATLQKFSIDHEILTPDHVSSRFPMVQIPAHWVAVYTQQGGVLRASKAVSMFLSLAAKHGATLRDQTKVLDVKSEVDGVTITTSRGSVRCGKCVITAGSWVSKLVKRMAGFDLPVVPIHTTIAYWEVDPENPDLYSSDRGFPVFLSYEEPIVYGTPSLEYNGMIKVSYHSGIPCDPDTRSVAPDHKALQDYVSPWLAKICKGNVRHDAPVLAEGCIYSITPDEDFILDSLPGKDDNILIAGGFSGHGFKMAPLVGRIMADLALAGSVPGIPMEYFSLNRFANNPQGNRKDYGAQVHLT
ncbi:hypothetical protein R1sor_014905 [Riccia sorocarpa]|uniref:sarcosine oxidasee (formaldehyde-forming) n=1 Tax=Riccia sorocarpa TaxID=122646 RepID=A0ABD3HCK0_9MARC